MIINNKSLRKIRLELDDYNLFSKVLCKNNNINYINSKNIAKDYDFIIDILNNNKNIKILNTLLIVNDNDYNNFINFKKDSYLKFFFEKNNANNEIIKSSDKKQKNLKNNMNKN